MGGHIGNRFLRRALTMAREGGAGEWVIRPDRPRWSRAAGPRAAGSSSHRRRRTRAPDLHRSRRKHPLPLTRGVAAASPSQVSQPLWMVRRPAVGSATVGSSDGFVSTARLPTSPYAAGWRSGWPAGAP
jgi:hypothetical protein